MKKHNLACTTMLVGKKASIDGSTMIARNEDYPQPIGPIKFTVVPAKFFAAVYVSKDSLEFRCRAMLIVIRPNRLTVIPITVTKRAASTKRTWR
ncbi:MAG: Hypothetical protein AJITA_01125 [Acetilactobacillus jinshanensis]